MKNKDFTKELGRVEHIVTKDSGLPVESQTHVEFTAPDGRGGFRKCYSPIADVPTGHFLWDEVAKWKASKLKDEVSDSFVQSNMSIAAQIITEGLSIGCQSSFETQEKWYLSDKICQFDQPGPRYYLTVPNFN